MNANRTPVEMITERKNLLSSNGAVSAIANRESFSGHFVELDEEQLAQLEKAGAEVGLSGQEFLQTKSWQLLRAVELDAVDYRAIAARLEERASKKKESVALKERTKTPDEEVTFRPCGPGWWLEVGGALCETIEKSAKAAGVTPEAWLQQVIGVGADGRRLPSLAA